MSEEIEIQEHPRWVPLVLHEGIDAVETSLREWFPEAEDAVGVEACIGMARVLLEDTEAGHNLAAWVLIPDGDRLQPITVATLRVLHVSDDTTVDDLVRSVVGETEHVQSPVVDTVPTASGPATIIRFRPTVRVEAVDEVHQVVVVGWLRAEDEAAYLLSAVSDDLVEGEDLMDMMQVLAEGVGGL